MSTKREPEGLRVVQKLGELVSKVLRDIRGAVEPKVQWGYWRVFWVEADEQSGVLPSHIPATNRIASHQH